MDFLRILFKKLWISSWYRNLKIKMSRTKDSLHYLRQICSPVWIALADFNFQADEKSVKVVQIYEDLDIHIKSGL